MFHFDGSRTWLITLFVLITVGGGILAMALRGGSGVPEYGYKVLRRFPHDEGAFTQGLLIDRSSGQLFESTGQYGHSTLREVELATGKVLRSVPLEEKLFGEGLALVGDRLIQLTWRENTAIVWDRDFNRLSSFSYEGEGWGLTWDPASKLLVMSNGTHKLSFRDPETFDEKRSVFVRRDQRPVNGLNELEWFGGKIYANQYQSDRIYEIDPRNGEVTAVIDLTGLWPENTRPENREKIPNGIAVNPENDHIIVTGKNWPWMYELELVLKER